jgi:hypothetical protein
MLQISTGKFFTTDDPYETRQRGVLYTNFRYHAAPTIETAAGTLQPLELGGDVAGLVYEVDQRLERRRPDGSPQILVAVGADSLIQDFAVIVSFCLEVTCSPDLDLVRRLTQAQQPPLGVPQVPRRYVRRVFDARVEAAPDDPACLQRFVADLMGLERQTYRAVMRAVRRYVTGLHRVGDDLPLAYTLLVASVESLAQKYDTAPPTWADYDERKRRAIDKAVDGAPPEVQERVRAAILVNEHVALSRRYKEFALAHLTPAFFRAEAVAVEGPVGLRDLTRVLASAYQFRSRYVHTLSELPRLVTMAPSHRDVSQDEDFQPMLSLQGLARVARHVIETFIARAPKVERETYNYWGDLPNTLRAQPAERYWIWKADRYSHRTAWEYLSGFLAELLDTWTGVPGARVTDLSAILVEIERRAPGLSPVQRLPMVSLYWLYHTVAPPVHHRPKWGDLVDRYISDFAAPSIESLVVTVLTDQAEGWTLEEFTGARDAYLAQRHHQQGIRLPLVLDAAITLVLAEKHRTAGDEVQARRYLTDAVQNLPGHRKLLALELAAEAGPVPLIAWRAVLLPPRALVTASETAPPASGRTEPEASEVAALGGTASDASAGEASEG